MSDFRDQLKKLLKSATGYDLQGSGKGCFAFGKGDVEITRFSPGSLLISDSTEGEFDRSQSLFDYLRQQRLLTIFKTLEISHVLDVGANKGQFALSLRKLGYKGRIISFEPVANVYRGLERAAQNDPNWETFQVALGKRNGEAEINVAEMPVFTSFLEANTECREIFGQGASGRRKETVTVQRLEDTLHETGLLSAESRIYLKMDTQGYDLEVFQGLGRLQSRVYALQSELSVVPIYEGMPHMTESIARFEEAGFQISGLYPVNIDTSTLRAIEFDCLMVNIGLIE